MIDAQDELEVNYGVLQHNVDNFIDSVAPFVMSDDPSLLLGPAVMVAEHTTQPTLYAYACRDIYDKKIEQKVLRFYIYGFPNIHYLILGYVYPKLVFMVH